MVEAANRAPHASRLSRTITMLTRSSSSRTSCSVESVASDAVAQKRRRPWVVAAGGAAQAEVKPAVLFTPPKERRYEQLVDEEASLPQTGQLSWASPMREAQRETSPPPSRCSQSLSQISPEIRAAIAAQSGAGVLDRPISPTSPPARGRASYVLRACCKLARRALLLFLVAATCWLLFWLGQLGRQHAWGGREGCRRGGSCCATAAAAATTAAATPTAATTAASAGRDARLARQAGEGPSRRVVRGRHRRDGLPGMAAATILLALRTRQVGGVERHAERRVARKQTT